MARRASMPMYDMAEIASALDDLWAGFACNFAAEGLADVPARLIHGQALRALWDAPDVWFSQCCGHDLIARYRGRLQPLATPRFAVPECRGRDYASVIVVAEDREADDIRDLRGTRCVVNGLESHSGANALRALVAPLGRDGRFFTSVVESGTHAASIEAVARGEADVAAIDCVTHALLGRYRPEALDGTRKLGVTEWAPGVPYVTPASEDAEVVARMRAAILRTFDGPDLASTREALRLDGVEATEVENYRQIAEFRDSAAREGYPELR